MLDDTEAGFLQWAGRLFLETAREDEGARFLERPVDWNRLRERADREGMSGIVAFALQRLARFHGADLPTASFSEDLRHTFARNGHHRARLTDLRTALGRAGVPVILLKGASLMNRGYDGRIGLRPLSDVDLLIRPPDMPRLLSVMDALDLRPANPYSTFYTNGSVAFDIHLDLIGQSRIRRRARAVRFDMDTVWRRALPFDSGDEIFRLLDPHHQFLHLTVHALKHSFSRIIWLVDLGLLAKHEKDWPGLLALAGETGAVRPLTYGLLALERLLACPVPAEVRESLPSLHRTERIFLDLVETRRPEMHLLGEPLLAWSMPSWSDRILYWAELLFPRRRTLSHDASSTPSWLLYPKRVSHLLARGISHLHLAARRH